MNDEQMKAHLLSFHTLRREMADEFVRDRMLRYDDYQLPKRSFAIQELIFGSMAQDFTLGLIGEVNRFLIGIAHADAWARIAAKCDQNDELALLWEFSEPQLELSVGRPYSIKNQFVFAAAHLLHQSKKLRDSNWKDDLPEDKKINYLLLERLNSRWDHFPSFLRTIDRLNDEIFRDGTRNFRHHLQHQFRKQFRFGLTGYFDRKKTPSGITYNYMLQPPIPLEPLFLDLYKQHAIASDLFKSYWNLLVELDTAWTTR